MWSSAANSTSDAAAVAPTNDHRSQAPISSVWSFDSAAFDANTEPSNPPPIITSNVGNPPTNNQNHASKPSAGAIGSGFVPNRASKSRMLWNRTAPEEEEREEEALPSYLTYLQPSFRSSSGSGLTGLTSGGERIQNVSSLGGLGAWGDANVNVPPSISTTSGLSASSNQFTPTSFSALSPTAGPFVLASSMTATTMTYGAGPGPGPGPAPGAALAPTGSVETKTKELALALQEFVRQQIDNQRAALAPPLPPLPLPARHSSSSPSPHDACDCDALKMRVADLEHKLLTLSQQVGGLMNGGGGHSVHAIQPPLPPTPPHAAGINGVASGLDSPSSASAAGGINDRVSTLEGRQSAFQSQLAQISKVLGVPIGKHGKNSQIKNLVQTLRDEIDAKLATSAKEVETKCVATVVKEVEHVVAKVVDERLQHVPMPPSTTTTMMTTTTPQLSYDTVFAALAEEHEASLGKLSAYFEERLGQESKQRVGLESRIQSRFGEHEEWLQQLEGEFGSWHDRSSSVAAQLRVLHNKIQEMDDKWNAEQLKWSKLASDMQLGLVGQGPHSTATAATTTTAQQATTTTTTTTTTVETLTRSVHQLQVQYKQFHSEYKTEASELRENLVLMDTWVKTTREETRDLGKNMKGMKQLVEKLVRDTGSAEELLQQYVSTITHQVASVTRQYVSVRIRDNNRLIDATLRARVPAYVENESESFMLVRPEKKSPEEASQGGTGLVLKDDDEDGMRSLLRHPTEDAAGVTSTTSTDSVGSLSPSKGDT